MGEIVADHPYFSLSEREGRGKIAVKLPLILFPAGAHENHVRPFDGADAR
jgi:hypothetical protein